MTEDHTTPDRWERDDQPARTGPEPVDVPDQEFDWSWIAEARQRELSAHGREVQARMAAGPPAATRPPSLLKRLRFRLYLLAARRRSRGSDSAGGR